MRTSAPPILPLFRSEMQLRLLALLLLQPERSWTLYQLTSALAAPQSSVHRELARAEAAGIIVRDVAARPHSFSAAVHDAMYEPLFALLSRSLGVELQLREVLQRDDVTAAVIHGSWAGASRRPDSDIDVLVVGEANLSELRRAVRPIARAAARRIDLTVLPADEFRQLLHKPASFAREILERPVIALVGELSSIALSDQSAHS